MVKLKLTKKDGTDFKAGDVDQPSISNNGLHTLFKSVSISLNGTAIHNVDNFYNWKEYMEVLLNYSPEVAKTRLGSQHYIPNGTENELAVRTANSKVVSFFGRINLMNLNRFILNNVTVSLKFNLETPDLVIREDIEKTKTTSQIKLLASTLYVRHVTPKEDLLLSQEKLLSAGKKNAIYQWKRGHIAIQNVTAGQVNLNIPVFHSGLRPSLVCFGMTANLAFCGSRTRTPFVFEPFNLTDFNFTVNGATRPMNPFRMTNTDIESTYDHMFVSLYNALGHHGANSCASVNRDNFITNNFLIVEDLTRFGTALTDVNDPLENCVLGVNASFASALRTNITCVMYMLIPCRMEINSIRQATVVY